MIWVKEIPIGRLCMILTINLDHRANQWTYQAQIESRWLFEELKTTNALRQHNHALNCMEIEESRRICCEETERTRQLRTDELHAEKKEDTCTVHQLLSQIRTLQDKMSEEKECYDPETASSSGMFHVPSQPSRILSPRDMLSSASRLPHSTRNSMDTSGNVFGEIYLLKKEYLRRCHDLP